MRNTMLATATALCMTTTASAEQNIHTFIEGGDRETYASTFAKDASRPMQGEGSFEGEVCGPIRVSNLPTQIQTVIKNIWGDVEQVRECTRPEGPMDDI